MPTGKPASPAKRSVWHREDAKSEKYFLLLEEADTKGLSDERAVEIARLMSDDTLIPMLLRKLLPGRCGEVQYRILQPHLRGATRVRARIEALPYAGTLKDYWVKEDLTSVAPGTDTFLSVVLRMTTTWGRDDAIKQIGEVTREAVNAWRGAGRGEILGVTLEAVPEIGHYIGLDMVAPILQSCRPSRRWGVLEMLWDADGLGSAVASITSWKPDFGRYAIGLLDGLPAKDAIHTMANHGDSIIKRIPRSVLAGWLEILAGRLSLEVGTGERTTGEVAYSFDDLVHAINILRRPRWQAVMDMRPILESLAGCLTLAREADLGALTALETQSGLALLPLPLTVAERMAHHPDAQVRQALTLFAGDIDIQDDNVLPDGDATTASRPVPG